MVAILSLPLSINLSCLCPSGSARGRLQPWAGRRHTRPRGRSAQQWSECQAISTAGVRSTSGSAAMGCLRVRDYAPCTKWADGATAGATTLCATALWVPGIYRGESQTMVVTVCCVGHRNGNYVILAKNIFTGCIWNCQKNFWCRPYISVSPLRLKSRRLSLLGVDGVARRVCVLNYLITYEAALFKTVRCSWAPSQYEHVFPGNPSRYRCCKYIFLFLLLFFLWMPNMGCLKQLHWGYWCHLAESNQTNIQFTIQYLSPFVVGLPHIRGNVVDRFNNFFGALMSSDNKIIELLV